jgi:hypothetical protein
VPPLANAVALVLFLRRLRLVRVIAVSGSFAFLLIHGEQLVSVFVVERLLTDRADRLVLSNSIRSRSACISFLNLRSSP